MTVDPVKQEVEARRQAGALLRRIGGAKRVMSFLAGDEVQRTLRPLIERLAAAPDLSRRQLLWDARAELVPKLQDVPLPEWSAAVETLLPKIAPSVVSALRILDRRPYQVRLSRMPFRSPRSAPSLAARRSQWLVNIALLLGDYDADIGWIAEHAAYLCGWWGAPDMAWLLAGAIDQGGAEGERVFDILASTCRGERGPTDMGRHVIQALLCSSRSDGWTIVERLLLAAQREEGLRQAILESVDEAHPQAFRHMLRVIREHRLARFSSTVRAADTWFAFLWDGASTVKVDSIVENVIGLLDDASARDKALAGDDAETAYLALWSLAFDDIDAAVPAAVKLLSSDTVDMRFVAAHLLAQSQWSSGVRALIDPLADADLRVAARALVPFMSDRTTVVEGARLFAQLEQLIARLSKRRVALPSLVWPWCKLTLKRSDVATAMAANASAVGGERVLPYVVDLEPRARAAYVRREAGLVRRGIVTPGENPKPAPLAGAARVVALDLLGDASPDVRSASFDALALGPVEDDEIERLFELLDRSAGDLRAKALVRLRTLPSGKLRTVIDRLSADGDDARRQAGAELSHQANVIARTVQEPSTDDALGLLEPGAAREWPEPRRLTIDLATRGATASLESLAQLVLANAQTEIRNSRGEARMLIEVAGFIRAPQKRADLDDQATALPLAELWRGWLRNRGGALCDDDGLELLRALMSEDKSGPWRSEPVKALGGLGTARAAWRFLCGILEWCIAWDPPPVTADFLLDGLEDSLAQFEPADFQAMIEQRKTLVSHWGAAKPPHQDKQTRAGSWARRLHWLRRLYPALFSAAHSSRLYALLRWFELRTRGSSHVTVTLEDFVYAYDAGAVDERELVDLLIGRASGRMHSAMLRAATTRRPPQLLAERPALLEQVDRCRRRVVEVEAARGDMPTAASWASLELRCSGDLETLTRAISALGKTHFARNFGWTGARSRKETLSHLVVRSFPHDDDTTEAFVEWARDARVPHGRLVELAVYAPQWAAHANAVLRWPGLEDAVWWIEAHTKDGRAWQLRDLKDEWAARVSERTPLTADDLTEGAVDVAWFHRVYSALDHERWMELDAAAKYAASSGGHTRAQLFARAMAGLVTRDAILERVERSRHQDSVRALGLLPLAEGAAREDDLLARFERLQEFRREARQFGSQRRQSETRAVDIALENLARTAGYPDPQRLQWAMEQRAVADLAAGPLTLQRGDATLSLAVDPDGVPSLSVARKGKTLKTIPTAFAKDPDVQALKERLQDLRRQRSRVRGSLEDAMCRGDVFTSSEIGALLQHPILAPAISRLVFVGDGVAGYPAERGKVLRDHAGTQHVLGRDEGVRIAHPHDLLTRGDWSAWQAECFRAERVQPFKQVFRELYPATDAERGTRSARRYAGHQVQPRQGLALLTGRGWVVAPDEGVSRTYHDAGITARLTFEEAFYTPAEVEGLTLEGLVFTRKGTWDALALDAVPSRVFSEAMRDLDLVVSVAHRGGVDPEATASTVEMRAALVRQTCALLRLDNVELEPNHAIVHGTLGSYSVHLGSAGVLMLPATALPIVAVHSQHRGRLFLPFADDDPRSAEVISKVLLLARDSRIRDPNILQWIRMARSGSPDPDLQP